MSAEIEFGDLHAERPSQGMRPDQNHYFAVVALGEPNPTDLLVYVDLDVMLEMESHAQSNTSVELGGVLMGRQLVDPTGRPFVVVEDSIRAQHYQATKGSFKFTHETWQQITRDRAQMPDSIQMVGWYHTHPDWGVFLSGMDDFICKNFFNRPLDLALVIDPCNNDRGWFQWVGDHTQRCAAFHVVAHRHRREELENYLNWTNESRTMTNGLKSSRTLTASGTTVQVVEREPRNEWVVYAMFTVQLIALLLMAWRVTVAPSPGLNSAAETAVNQAQEWDKVSRLEYRNDALAEALRLSSQDPNSIVKMSEELADARQKISHQDAAIVSHLVRIAELENSIETERLTNQQLRQVHENLIAQSKKSSPSSADPSSELSWVQRHGLTIAISSLLVSMASILGTLWWGNRRFSNPDWESVDESDDLKSPKTLKL